MATLCGLSPLEFWEITPFELGLVIKGYAKRKEEEYKEKLSIAYMNSVWTIQWLGKKSNHPKPLQEILEGLDKEKEQMTDEEMLNQVKMLNILFGGREIEDVS